MSNPDTDPKLSAVADLVEGAAASDSFFDPATPHPAPEAENASSRHGVDGDFPADDGLEGADDDPVIPDMPESERATISPATIALCAAEPANDTGNGQRLLFHFGAELINVREAAGGREAGWHYWTGTHWRREGGNEMAGLFAQRTAPRIALEADFLAATPAEARAIEQGGKAKRELDRLEKSKAEWTDADRDKADELEQEIEAGLDADAELKRRKLNRRKFAISSGNASRQRAMIDMALPHRTISQEQLDADPYAFNCLKGTLRFYQEEDTECPDPDAKRMLWKVRLDPHLPDDLISKIAPVNFSETAEAPIFRSSIERFQPNKNIRHWLQKYFGYSMLGVNGEQCMLFNHGGGANWKSTCVEIISRVMGDYAMTLKFESLAGDGQTTGAQASPDIARLPGARLVRASEPDRGVALKEGLIKSITGGEPMLARHNFGNFFSFYPEFKMVLSGNHKPDIGGVDHGIWRRIRFVPWPVTISDEERREFDEVIAELWAERDGILAWLVEGALLYLREGLAPPQEIIDATEDYREEMDIVGSFIKSCVTQITPAEGATDIPFVAAQAMYEAFEAWCGANGHRAWKQKSFGQALSQKGFVKDRKSTMRRYLWIKLHDVPARSSRRNDAPPHPADDEIPA